MILRRSHVIIGVWIALTAALGLATTSIRIDPEVVRLLPNEDKAQYLLETLGKADKDLNYLIVMLRTPEPFTVAALQSVEDADRIISSQSLINSSLTPLNIPTFRFEQGRLQLAHARHLTR